MPERALRRVRFLAAHVEEMQGLRTVAWVLWTAVTAVVWPFFPDSGWLSVGRFFLFGLYMPLVGEPLRRYYGRRVGRVGGRPFPGVELRWGVWLLVAIPLTNSPHPSAALFLVWSAYPVYVVASGWPYRAHHLLTVAAAAWVAWSG